MTAQTVWSGCRTKGLRQKIRFEVTRKLPQRAWRGFRCHLGRAALDLAPLVSAMQERASVSHSVVRFGQR